MRFVMIVFNLERLLSDRGWTDYRFAQESGIARIIVGKYRRNAVRQPDLETLNSMCATLGCKIGDLMEYVPDKQTKAPKTTTASKPRAKKR